MTIHQLSVFVENKSGTLLQVLELLKEAGIQLIASTISDTVEYGIYRIICSEPMRAYDTLKQAGISANLSKDRHFLSLFVPAFRKRHFGIPYR